MGICACRSNERPQCYTIETPFTPPDRHEAVPEPRAQSPEPRAQSPEPRAQSPEPRAQSPIPTYEHGLSLAVEQPEQNHRRAPTPGSISMESIILFHLQRKTRDSRRTLKLRSLRKSSYSMHIPQ